MRYTCVAGDVVVQTAALVGCGRAHIRLPSHLQRNQGHCCCTLCFKPLPLLGTVLLKLPCYKEPRLIHCRPELLS